VLFGLLVSASSGCELVADFDTGDTEGRTVPVTPLPMLDGAVPIVVDGSVRDGAVVIGGEARDAGGGDAGVLIIDVMDAGTSTTTELRTLGGAKAACTSLGSEASAFCARAPSRASSACSSATPRASAREQCDPFS
jgi:hypothetical protein